MKYFFRNGNADTNVTNLKVSQKPELTENFISTILISNILLYPIPIHINITYLFLYIKFIFYISV